MVEPNVLTTSPLLPWQQVAWQTLWQRHLVGQLPHALLCSGAAGLGKQRFVQRLAQALLCEAPADDGSPCQQCRSCRLFKAMTHPDYCQVGVLDGKKQLLVDQIREATLFLSYTRQVARYKIVVIHPAEKMNLNAANSLLKTLEEPAPNSVLLLVTAWPAQLPATVRSRCLRVPFTPPPLPVAAAWLAPQLTGGIDPNLLLCLHGGAPLAALAAADPERLARRQTLFQNYCDVITQRIDPLRAVPPWLQGDVAENIRWVIGWTVDMVRLKLSTAPPRLYNPDLASALQRQSEHLSAQQLFHQLDAAMQLLRWTATEANAQLMIETFFLECVACS